MAMTLCQLAQKWRGEAKKQRAEADEDRREHVASYYKGQSLRSESCAEELESVIREERRLLSIQDVNGLTPQAIIAYVLDMVLDAPEHKEVHSCQPTKKP